MLVIFLFSVNFWSFFSGLFVFVLVFVCFSYFVFQVIIGGVFVSFF